MGAGTLTASCYAVYNTSLGREYDTTTHVITGQTFEAKHIDASLDPAKFSVRECINTDEHPNTIPVILALDVTGSMGDACSETAATLGKIVLNLYKKYQDIEFCIMGIGDLAYDKAPIQMSQFESDIRIAESIDKIYIEHGGGGNAYESYTAAWYMGLYHTKLDCFDKQHRKGIIITMGDEPLNPYLPSDDLNASLGHKQFTDKDIETNALYKNTKEKFDIYHIAVDSPYNCYNAYKDDIANSFGQLLGKRLKISTIEKLSDTIEECISEAIDGISYEESSTNVNEKGEIHW